MVTPNLAVLLSPESRKRPVTYSDPKIKRSRRADFRLFRLSNAFEIANHESSNASEDELDSLRHVVHQKNYCRYLDDPNNTPETHQPGLTLHKFDSVWVVFGPQLQRAVCFREDSAKLVVLHVFPPITDDASAKPNKRFLNSMESKWAFMNPRYGQG